MIIMQRPDTAPPSDPPILNAVTFDPWPFHTGVVKLTSTVWLIDGNGDLEAPRANLDDPYVLTRSSVLAALADGRYAVATAHGFVAYADRNGWAS